MLSKTKRPTAAEVVANRIDAVTTEFTKREPTARRLNAALILARCLEAQGSPDHPSPFPELQSNGNGGGAPSQGGLWASGDLAGGTGGSEFIYAYMPVQFVEELIKAVEGLIPPDLPEGIALDIASAPATAATMYFVGTLRAAIDEAVANLFCESANVAGELIISSLAKDRSHAGLNKEEFNNMLNRIIEEGNERRKERIEEAMVDGIHLKQLSLHYRSFHPAWKSAADIFAANKTRSTWKRTDWKAAIQSEVLADHGIALPLDLISLISDDYSDWLLTPNRDDELNPSALALIHAARVCGAADFAESIAKLRMTVSRQEKKAGEVEEQLTVQ